MAEQAAPELRLERVEFLKSWWTRPGNLAVRCWVELGPIMILCSVIENWESDAVVYWPSVSRPGSGDRRSFFFLDAQLESETTDRILAEYRAWRMDNPPPPKPRRLRQEQARLKWAGFVELLTRGEDYRQHVGRMADRNQARFYKLMLAANGGGVIHPRDTTAYGALLRQEHNRNIPPPRRGRPRKGA